MTQSHLVQTSPTQSQVVPIPFINESMRLMLHRLAVGVAATVAIACQAEVPTPLPTVAVSPVPVVGTVTLANGDVVYHSARFGFHFTYPADQFVAIEDTDSSPEVEAVGAIQIWTTQHDRAIKAGEYEGGAEYPANVSVTVQPNPSRLPLKDWVQQTDWLTGTRDITETPVAGQAAIAFQSSGLYEQENVALVSPDGTSVVLITLNKTNYSNNDVPYQAVYQQIVSSLAFDQ